MLEIAIVFGIAVAVGGGFLIAKDDLDWRFGTGLAIVLVGVAVVLFAGAGLAARASCRATSTQGERQVRWDFFGGCFVHLNGEWFPKDQLGDLRLRGGLDD